MGTQHSKTPFSGQKRKVYSAKHKLPYQSEADESSKTLFNNVHRELPSLGDKCENCKPTTADKTNLDINRRSKRGLESPEIMPIKIPVEKNIETVAPSHASVLRYKNVSSTVLLDHCYANSIVDQKKLILTHKTQNTKEPDVEDGSLRLEPSQNSVLKPKTHILTGGNIECNAPNTATINKDQSSTKYLSKTRVATIGKSRIISISASDLLEMQAISKAGVSRANKRQRSTPKQFETKKRIQRSCSYNKKPKIDCNQTKVQAVSGESLNITSTPKVERIQPSCSDSKKDKIDCNQTKVQAVSGESLNITSTPKAERIQPSCSDSKKDKIDCNQTKVQAVSGESLNITSTPKAEHIVKKATSTNVPIIIREMQQKISKKISSTPLDISLIINEKQLLTETNNINNSMLKICNIPRDFSSIMNEKQLLTETSKINSSMLNTKMNEQELRKSRIAANTRLRREGINSRVLQKIYKYDYKNLLKYPPNYKNFTNKWLMARTRQVTNEIDTSKPWRVSFNSQTEEDVAVVDKPQKFHGRNTKSSAKNKQMKAEVALVNKIDSKQTRVSPRTTAIATSNKKQSNCSPQICEDEINTAITKEQMKNPKVRQRIKKGHDKNSLDASKINKKQMAITARQRTKEVKTSENKERTKVHKPHENHVESFANYKQMKAAVALENKIDDKQVRVLPTTVIIDTTTKRQPNHNEDNKTSEIKIIIKLEPGRDGEIMHLSEERQMEIKKEIGTWEVIGLLGCNKIRKVEFDEETSECEIVPKFEPAELVKIPEKFTEFGASEAMVTIPFLTWKTECSGDNEMCDI